MDDGAVSTYDGYFEDFRAELHKEIADQLDADEKAAAAKAAERAEQRAARAASKKK